MKIRRILSVFLLTVLLSTMFCIAPAYALEDPDIQAAAALLVDADTGHVLYAKNENVRRAPASLTKLMVSLLVMEALERGELKLDQPITATVSSLANLTPDSSTADIRAGETLTVEQLLYCMLLVSANEVGDIIGEAYCGSVGAFIDLMNQRAMELGCTNTNFVNSSGLDDPNHYTTAWDLYLITREVMKYDTFMTICNSKSYTVPETNISGARELHTTNGLISNWRYLGYLYDGAVGIKTGTTPEAGRCLVSSAKRSGRSLVSVMLGAGLSEDGRIMSFLETARLFDWGFDNFVFTKVTDEDKLYAVPVELSKETDTIMVHPEETTEVLLPKDLVPETDLTYKLDLPESVDAPIAAGQRLGTVTVIYNGEEYAVVPLLAVSDVSSSRFLIIKRTIQQYLAMPYVRIGLIALAVLILVLVIWLRLTRTRRRYRRGGKRYRGRSR